MSEPSINSAVGRVGDITILAKHLAHERVEIHRVLDTLWATIVAVDDLIDPPPYEPVGQDPKLEGMLGELREDACSTSLALHCRR